MLKSLVLFTITLLVIVTFTPFLRAQNQRDQPPGIGEELRLRKWNNSPPLKSTYANKPKAAPAPRRDLSGIWDGWAEGGTEAVGPIDHTAEGYNHDNGNKIWGQPDESGVEHPLPYTPAGLKALQANRPGTGVRSTPDGLINDPANFGNPQGFPRMEFYEFRVFEWVKLKNQWIFVDQFGQNYRIIWADGRQLPDVHQVEPRWFGYSVGKWTDDYTFEIDTVGVNDSTWIDNAGRPHTVDMRVHEIWHRVDFDTLELTTTVDDPAYYSAKWNGLTKYILHRLPDDYDMEEFIYTNQETQEYNGLIANPVTVGAPLTSK